MIHNKRMFHSKFTLTNQISTNLSEIERLYGRLEGMRIPQQLLLNLERTNLVQSAYISNSIEGNPLSHAVVTNLLLSDRIPTNRSEKEVVNYFQVLKSLNQKANESLDQAEILQIHRELMTGVDEDIKGKIRDEPIVVGNRLQEGAIYVKHNPPFHDKPAIEQALLELTGWVEIGEMLPVLKAGIFHHQFVYLHPFKDGNGRTCRLATALIFLKYNYLINKYFVLDDYYDIDRGAYSDSLHSADSGDKTKWLEYFTDGVKYSLQSALGRVETGLTKLNFNVRPTSKEQEALDLIQNRQITSADLTRELNISRQQAFNLLRSLVKKGYLEKQGRTKNSYYLLK